MKIKLIDRCLKLLIVFLFIHVYVLLFSSTAFAQNELSSFSWTEKPTVYSSDLASPNYNTSCSGSVRYVEIAGELSLGKVCFLSDGKIGFGINQSDWYRAVVQFPYDKLSYKVNNICSIYTNCLYSAINDTLYTKQYLRPPYIYKSLVGYKNFSKRLIRKINLSTFATEYDFNADNPDFIMIDEYGGHKAVGGFGLSDNGEWLAIEIVSEGIALINVKSNTIKQIDNNFLRYGYGTDPASEFAVTNDGNHVAMMGTNVGFSIYTVDESCGKVIDNNNFIQNENFKPCLRSYYYDNPIIGTMRHAYVPKFSSDGGELTFYLMNNSYQTLHIVLRASGYNVDSVEYIALGDSYSSGEGEYSDEYYAKGTNDKFEKCHLSTRSYPYLIAETFNVEVDKMKSVACSGAKVEDIVSLGVDYWGQDERLGKEGLKLDQKEVDSYKLNSLALFLPGRNFQIDFIKTYKPKYLTVGVGGNDVGFADKVKACIGPDTCSWVDNDVKKSQAGLEMQGLFEKLANMYESLKKASEKTKIYAIGYPKLISRDNCKQPINVLFNKAEREYIDESVLYLNQIIESAAKKAGVVYVDIYDSFGKKVLCENESPSAMNFIRFGDDFGPFNFFKFIGQESFHPNPTGHQLSANLIAKSITDMNNYNSCSDDKTFCPDENIEVPELSDYWGVESDDEKQPKLQVSNITSGFDSEGVAQLKIDDLMLHPGSKVSIEINSEPLYLGDYDVSADGSLDVEVRLPEGFAEGYHTIFVRALSFSGEQIELYQVVKYQKTVIPGNESEVNNATDFIEQIREIEGVGSNTFNTAISYEIADNLESLITNTNPNNDFMFNEHKQEVLGDSTKNDVSVTKSIGVERSDYLAIIAPVVVAILLSCVIIKKYS